jgi:DNA-binding NarL/FixJ family response regulator
MAPNRASSPYAANGTAQPVTVLIADPNALSRSGLHTLLDHDPHFKLVAETATHVETVAQRSHPDLIIVDPATRGTIDQNLIAGLRRAAPSSRIAVLTNVFEPHSFMATMLQGVHVYLLKESISQNELMQGAFTLIARFGVVVTDAPIAERFWSYAGAPITVHLPHPTVLTGREAEVLSLAIEGLTDKEIAERLTIASRTVDFHIRAAAGKLGGSNRLQLGWLLHERGAL